MSPPSFRFHLPHLFRLFHALRGAAEAHQHGLGHVQRHDPGGGGEGHQPRARREGDAQREAGVRIATCDMRPNPPGERSGCGFGFSSGKRGEACDLTRLTH